MSDTIVGILFCKNEADIIEEVVFDAIKHVDVLYIADGRSKDRTWDIVQSLQQAHPDKIEHVQQESEWGDPAQRNSLLNLIRSRYRADNTWVQIIESDIFILDTDLRQAIRDRAYKDMAVSWQALNAVRPVGTWDGFDTYPNWPCSIRQIMNRVHFLEVMLYTFRPLPELHYNPDIWRPWPQGWSHYSDQPVKRYWRQADSPLLLHCGYRGPTHFWQKYKHMGERHRKYKKWILTSPKTVEQTVGFFNGDWNGDIGTAEPTREGWQKIRIFLDEKNSK